jgi:hypothetical protein
VGEVETALKGHPGTRIIWAHARISRRIVIANHTEIISRMLRTYPSRFVIGSDILGVFDQYKPTIQRYYLLLDALKPETAQKVAHDNFLALLPRLP